MDARNTKEKKISNFQVKYLKRKNSYGRRKRVCRRRRRIIGDRFVKTDVRDIIINRRDRQANQTEINSCGFAGTVVRHIRGMTT